MQIVTAKKFVKALITFQSDTEAIKIGKFFKGSDPSNKIIGVRMKNTFDLAKEYKSMSLPEVEKLLDSQYYEARMGAVSIMDFKTRGSKVTGQEREKLFELYIHKHDRINNWDLVDRSAPRVVGWYLLDKPKDILYKLAKSANIWERRTAITATFWMIRQGQVEDALRISEILINDPEGLVNKSVGTGLREIGLQDQQRLIAFLNIHVKSMPRVTLRYSVEKLSKQQKNHYLNLKK